MWFVEKAKNVAIGHGRPQVGLPPLRGAQKTQKTHKTQNRGRLKRGTAIGPSSYPTSLCTNSSETYTASTPSFFKLAGWRFFFGSCALLVVRMEVASRTFSVNGLSSQ